MTSTKPTPTKLTKRKQDLVLGHTESALREMSGRFMAHIDFDITDAQLFEAVVHPDDYAVVRRSNDLYGYTRKSYYGSQSMRVAFVAGSPFVLEIDYKPRLSWLPPAYAMGDKNISDMPPLFEQIFAPYMEQATPIMEEYKKARNAWNNLRSLCMDDLSRIYFLWPALNTLVRHFIDKDINLDTQLSKPRGAPAVSPELRTQLNDATTFINTALLLPAAAPVRNMDGRVGLGIVG